MNVAYVWYGGPGNYRLQDGSLTKRQGMAWENKDYDI